MSTARGMRTTIKVPEIAARLGVCEPTVRDLLRRQIIPNVRYGRIWIVSRTAFERWEQAIGESKIEVPCQSINVN